MHNDKRIITLNIRSGGGQRVDALLRYLEAQEPDTVVLTEWRLNSAGQQIMAWAGHRGMHHSGLADAGTPNGILVASKSPFTSEKRTPIGTGAGVLKLLHFDRFAMLACYFPQKWAKAPFFDRCFEIVAEHTATPFLILGDLNTGNQIVDKQPTGRPYKCAPLFNELSEHCGLRDLWRCSNGPEAREWTWLSGRQNGFRIDHAFGNTAFVEWAAPTCKYDHAPRPAFTDHSAIIVAMHV